MQVIELAVPALFLFLMGLIKDDFNPESYPGDIPLADTPVPTYADLQTFASHPNVLCYDNNLFFRCADRTTVVSIFSLLPHCMYVYSEYIPTKHFVSFVSP